MSLFGALVRTAANLAALPVAAAKDSVAYLCGDDPHEIEDAVERLKREAAEED